MNNESNSRALSLRRPAGMILQARLTLGLALVALTSVLHAQLKWAAPAQSGSNVIGVVNLTNDYTVRHWANYHNVEAWSTNGRWVCYTRFAADRERFGSSSAMEVHVIDLLTG